MFLSGLIAHPGPGLIAHLDTCHNHLLTQVYNYLHCQSKTFEDLELWLCQRRVDSSGDSFVDSFVDSFDDSFGTE